MIAGLDGRELILGVTGSIAAYKAVYLLRELTRRGAQVTVCLSEHAREFVGPLTFRTLSGRVSGLARRVRASSNLFSIIASLASAFVREALPMTPAMSRKKRSAALP